MHTTPDVVKAMPATLVGSTEHIIEKLQANREQWDLSYPVFPASTIDALVPVVRRLAGQ